MVGGGMEQPEFSYIIGRSVKWNSGEKCGRVYIYIPVSIYP